MAGGYFVTGFGLTYFGGWRDTGIFDVDDPKYDEAEEDLTSIKDFFTNLEWWKLNPADCLVSVARSGEAGRLQWTKSGWRRRCAG